MNQNSNQDAQMDEVGRAMAELVAWRNARFDKQDSAIWLEYLEPHNHSGLTIEAARRFGEDEALQDTPVTLAAFLRVVKQIRSERIEAMKDQFPQPPSAITDEQYRMWIQFRNECAVRGYTPEEIDRAARQAINAPQRGAISDRPAPVLYLPPSSSAQ